MSGRNTIDKIINKVREFRGSSNWKNFLTFLFFLSLAFAYWILQYYQQTFEVELPAEIHYKNIPADIVISDNLPDKINIKVLDKGTTFWGSIFSGDKYITIDLSNLPSGKNTYTIDKLTLYNEIKESLKATVNVQSISPENIVINYSPLEKKEVPVVLEGTLQPASGFIFTDSISIIPASVLVFSDKQTLDTLRYVSTNRIEKKDISSELKFKVSLTIPNHAKIEPTEVQISAKVEECTEKAFTITPICKNLPANKSIRFFPSTVELYVTVGISQYTTITESDFSIEVDYDDLINEEVASARLSLTRYPQEIINYRIVPNEIEFMFEQKTY